MNKYCVIIQIFFCLILALHRPVEASLIYETFVTGRISVKKGFSPRYRASSKRRCLYPFLNEGRSRRFYSASISKDDGIKTQKKLEQAKKFEIILSNDEFIKAEIFKLRYHMIKEIHPSQYWNNFSFTSTSQEIDEYDIHSDFCALKSADKIVGTGRIILGQKDRPAQSFVAQIYNQHFYKGFSYEHIPIEHIAEVSRQYVYPEYRGAGAFLAILKGRIALCEQNGVTHIFARMVPELAEIYKSYGLHYTQISTPYQDAGLTRVISFTSLQTLLDKLYEQNSEIWKYVTSDGQYFPYQGGISEKYLEDLPKKIFL